LDTPEWQKLKEEIDWLIRDPCQKLLVQNWTSPEFFFHDQFIQSYSTSSQEWCVCALFDTFYFITLAKD